jgi:hypothetical protein
MSASAAARSLPQPAPGDRRARPAGGPARSRRSPRRYSGPSAGVASAAAVAAPGVLPRLEPGALPRRAPGALPRRAPAAPRRAPRTRARRATASVGLPIAGLISPRRLIALGLRGRVWIGLLAVGLIGLITLQLIVLRLNTSIGQSLEQATRLSRENAAMAITNSEASSGEAIETLAHKLGMVALSPGELHFRRVAGSDGAQAAARLLVSTKALSASESQSATGLSTEAQQGVAASTQESEVAGSQTEASGSPTEAGGSGTELAGSQPEAGAGQAEPGAGQAETAGSQAATTGTAEQQTPSTTAVSPQSQEGGQEAPVGAIRAPGAGG